MTYANSYMATKFSADEWYALTDPQKEAALIEATRQIDAHSWRGDRFFYHQILKFPRTLVATLTDSGRTIVQTPTLFDVEYARQERQCRYACAEQALWLARTRGRDRHAEAIVAGVSNRSESVGGYSESYAYGGKHQGLCPEAFSLLREWRTPPRLVRA